MFDFIERGVLMDEAGGAELGGGGMGGDAGDLGGIGTELATIPSGGELSTEDGGADDLGDTSTEVSTFRATDPGGKLTRQAQEALAPLKQSTPALHRLFYKNQGIVSRLQSMFPPGINAFDAIKSYQRIFKELGGEQGIQETRNSLAEMEDVDLLFSAGDPQLLDKYLMSTPEGKAAMMKLLPHVVARLENEPGGPAAILALANKASDIKDRLMPKAVARETWRTVLYGLKNNGVDLAIKRMASLIPKDDPIAAEAATALNFLANLESAASSTDVEAAPAPVTEVAKKADDTLSADRQQFEKDRMEFRKQDWGQASNSLSNATFERAWAELSKGKKFTAKDKENITALVGVRMGVVYRGISGYSQERNRMFQANDRAGFLAYMKDLYSRNIPRVLKAEIAGYGGAGKPAAAAATVPGVPGAQRVAPQVGFRAVATQPPSNHIDHRPTATTKAMIIAHQAIIKPEYRQHYGGSEKVQWPTVKR